jgi:hypothetical protein
MTNVSSQPVDVNGQPLPEWAKRQLRLVGTVPKGIDPEVHAFRKGLV